MSSSTPATSEPVTTQAGQPVTSLSAHAFRRKRILPLQSLWTALSRCRAGLKLAFDAGRAFAIDRRERRAGAQGRLRHVLAGQASGAGRSLALYAHFSPHGGISDMVLAQLRDYARHGFRVVVVSAAPALSKADEAAICEVAELLLVRRNYALDFGAWSDAANLVRQVNEELEELLLVNDSVLGPLHPLDLPLARMRDAGDGLFGLTESVQHAPHLQSYFLLARGAAAITDLLGFLRQAPLSTSKRRTIQRCEIGLSSHMRGRGHRVGAVWGYAAMEGALVGSESGVAALLAAMPGLERQRRAGPDGMLALRRALLDLPLNPTHHLAALLVREVGFPFLKTELVLRNPTRMPDVVDWQALVPPSSPVSLRLIADHLLRIEQPLRPANAPAAVPSMPDPVPDLGTRQPWQNALDAAWRHQGSAPPPVAAGMLLKAETVLQQAARLPLILSFSHDDYAGHCGGVQNVIAAEQRGFAAEGIGYLHCAPVVPSLALSKPDPGARYLLRLDGKALGIAVLPELLRVCQELAVRRSVQAGIVHHLAGHAPEHVLALLQAAGVEQPLFWLHDFGSLCSNPALLRNDVAFCGAPGVDSAACMVCSYGAVRQEHTSRMRAFFDAARPQILAPSRSAVEFWRSRSSYAYDDREIAVVPPARLIAAPMPPMPRNPNRPLRIAHLGTRHFHKGWDVFAALAASFGGDPRYEFLQLGLADDTETPKGLRFVAVRVGPDNPMAMADAVAAEAVDVVVNWSRCHETFSFTAHEALAGGALVVVREGAGNVLHVVAGNAPDRGIVLRDQAALQALFEGDRLREAVAATPAARRLLLPGSGSAEWLLARTPQGAALDLRVHV